MKLPGQLKGPWPPAKPGADSKTGFKSTEAGKNYACTYPICMNTMCISPSAELAGLIVQQDLRIYDFKSYSTNTDLELYTLLMY